MSILIKGWYEEPTLFYIYNQTKKMFTLGIPNRQYRRATNVLQNEPAEPINHDVVKQDDGFYLFNFPNVDEFDFKDIVLLLKRNGITTIGADDQLTERKIMKLTDLIQEKFTSNVNENDESLKLINALKRTVQSWSNKQYPDDKTKAEEFTLDIEELIEDFEEQQEYDRGFYTEGKKDKLRKLIRKTIRQ